jgi:hypothetical protein
MHPHNAHAAAHGAPAATRDTHAAADRGAPPSLDRLAWAATLHCLTGCGIGEVAGMTIGTALAWSNGATIALAVLLAFVFGYALTLRPLVRSGVPWRSALRTALAADTASIAVMEIVDNAVMLVVPGAMNATLASPLFWGSLALALAIAALAAWPVNRMLIRRGAGHALVHAHPRHRAS